MKHVKLISPVGLWSHRNERIIILRKSYQTMSCKQKKGENKKRSLELTVWLLSDLGESSGVQASARGAGIC